MNKGVDIIKIILTVILNMLLTSCIAQKKHSISDDYIFSSMKKIVNELELHYYSLDSVWQKTTTHSMAKIYSNRDAFYSRQHLYNDYRKGCDKIEIYDVTSNNKLETEVVSYVFYNDHLVIYYLNAVVGEYYKVCDICTVDINKLDYSKNFIVHSTVDKNGNVHINFNAH